MKIEEVLNNGTLTDCTRCGSDACFKVENQSTTTYHCFGCGFATNTLMTVESRFYTEQVEHLPELYKDLAFTDGNGLVWIPSYLSVEEVGMIFASGPSKDNWRWTAVRAVKRTEEDRKRNPNLKSDWKMDMSNQQFFAERDYMDALSCIGVIP